MGNLSEILKNHKREILFIAIVFLVATLSFALGYLTNREFHKAPIIIENNTITE